MADALIAYDQRPVEVPEMRKSNPGCAYASQQQGYLREVPVRSDRAQGAWATIQSGWKEALQETVFCLNVNQRAKAPPKPRQTLDGMKPLDPPDNLHLEAAKGWCELEAFSEATAELDKVRLEWRNHPLVLEARWQIYANQEKWGGALEIATALVTMCPDWPNGYIYRASSLAELNRHLEAYETLSAGVSLFPADAIVLYDLACVCCALKRPDEARTWLGKAIEAGGDDVKLRALDDPDLEPVWKGTTGP